MSELAVLLQAIAALLWPVFAFTALFVFKTQIADLARRLKRGKLLGQEIELNESLNQLRQSAVLVEQEVAALPATKVLTMTTTDQMNQDSVQRRIAAEAARSPHAALIMLAGELEILARQLLASLGRLQERQSVPFSRAMAELHSQFELPEQVQAALEDFRNVRNRLLHEGKGTDEDILRAIDSGLTILKALQTIPREINVVFEPGVTVYSDSPLQNAMVGVKGIILETLAPDRMTKTLRIFPTTRTHFEKGRQVAWEWNMQLSWTQAWYRHPIDGEVHVAWLSAAEFVGRHLDEV